MSPQSPAQIIGSGLELGFGVYLKLFMATSLIAFLQLLPTMDLALRLGNTEFTPEYRLEQQFSLHQCLLQLATLLLILLVQGMAIARLDHLAKGLMGDYRDEWRRALKAFLPLLGAILLSLGIIVAGCLMGAVIGLLIGLVGGLLFGKAGFALFFALTLAAVVFYVLIYMLFMQYCIVLEAKGPITAVNRSFRLVYGKWWRSFTVIVLMLLIIVLGGILFGIVLAPAMMATGGNLTGRGVFIMGVIQMAVGAVIAPVMLAVFYTLYHDLKLRSPEA